MARGGVEQQYEELFTYACPKFINAAPPTLDAPSTNTNQVGRPTQQQSRQLCASGAAHTVGTGTPKHVACDAAQGPGAWQQSAHVQALPAEQA